MARVADRIQKVLPEACIEPLHLRPEDIITKLIVRLVNVQIKIEVTPVLRGTVYEPVMMTVTLKNYDSFDPSQGGQIVQSWDTASKDNAHNDYSVCITALVRGKYVTVVDVVRKKMQFPELLKTVGSLARAHKATAMLAEDAASGSQLIQTLRASPSPGVPMPIARKPEGDKTSRVAGISAMIEAGQLILPAKAPWLADFKSELLAFPNARFDDQVDALSQLMIWVRRRDDGPATFGAPIVYYRDDYDQAWEHDMNGLRPVFDYGDYHDDVDPWL